MKTLICPNCKNKIELSEKASVPDECPFCFLEIDSMQTLSYEINQQTDTSILKIWCNNCNHFSPFTGSNYLRKECEYCFANFNYKEAVIYEISKNHLANERCVCFNCSSYFRTNDKRIDNCPKCSKKIENKNWQQLCLECGEYYYPLPWAGFECTNCNFKKESP